MKNRKLNQWLWKWHFIAGIISLPFVLVLSITGAVYLFKPTVEKEAIAAVQIIKETHESPISYQKQFGVASEHFKKKPTVLIVQNNSTQSTEFISGKFGDKKSVFVNQYTGEITGELSSKSTWMYTVRKLHGELLGGKIGTKIIELIASWMLVLIITGLYIWWPSTKGIKGFFTIRLKEGKRILYRDLHGVIGFWLSWLLLLTIAGGLPWTDFFGSNFKTLQKITNTGYPKTWSGKGLVSKIASKSLTLDDMVAIANQQNLKGVVSIGLPKSTKSTFSISNETSDLEQQKMLHFDQYSGNLVKSHNWSDVGFLMQGRMWVMAFHQGQFGAWNWWVMFALAILLTLMSFAAILSYIYRKQKGNLGIPKVSSKFKAGKAIVFILVLLGIILPIFGISLIFILILEKLFKKNKIVL